MTTSCKKLMSMPDSDHGNGIAHSAKIGVTSASYGFFALNYGADFEGQLMIRRTGNRQLPLLSATCFLLVLNGCDSVSQDPAQAPVAAEPPAEASAPVEA
ncbi:MAG: hypothetical protein R3192_02530, partial [Woeseiaceae bacterium]|nr:hypothetical protein [Woeseiaceae bacterium]